MNWDTAEEGQPMDESMGFVFEDPVTYEIMVQTSLVILNPPFGSAQSIKFLFFQMHQEKAVMAPCGHSFSETTVADWHKVCTAPHHNHRAAESRVCLRD
jgi:hypothetical protein